MRSDIRSGKIQAARFLHNSFETLGAFLALALRSAELVRWTWQ
jgi:hypothetical protein